MIYFPFTVFEQNKCVGSNKEIKSSRMHCISLDHIKPKRLPELSHASQKHHPHKEHSPACRGTEAGTSSPQESS